MNHDPQFNLPCNVCNKPIKFITIKKTGSQMPVDAKMIVAKEGELRGSFVSAGGEIKKFLRKGEVGYRSHWESCKKEKQQ